MCKLVLKMTLFLLQIKYFGENVQTYFKQYIICYMQLTLSCILLIVTDIQCYFTCMFYVIVHTIDYKLAKCCSYVIPSHVIVLCS